jgi:hypothetical protein
VRGEDFECVTQQVCDDPSSIPFWLAVILGILLLVLLVSLVQPKKDPTPPLKKAVDDVLAGYEKQAQVWGDREAVVAFGNARRDVAAAVDKYKPPDPV